MVQADPSHELDVVNRGTEGKALSTDIRRAISFASNGAYAKNGAYGRSPLNFLVKDALTRHPHPPDAEWVFTRSSGIPYKSVRGFNTVCTAADLKGVTLHTLWGFRKASTEACLSY